MAERRPRYRTGDDDLDRRVEQLLDAAGIDRNSDLAFELMTSVLRMGREGLSRGDLKIANSTLKEMRYAFHVFDPYRSVRKLAIFGSARTGIDEPAYAAARDVGREIADEGWDVGEARELRGPPAAFAGDELVRCC